MAAMTAAHISPSCSRGACGRDRRRHIADAAASSFLQPIDRGNYRRRFLQRMHERNVINAGAAVLSVLYVPHAVYRVLHIYILYKVPTGSPMVRLTRFQHTLPLSPTRDRLNAV